MSAAAQSVRWYVTDVTPFSSTEIQSQSAHDDLLVPKLVERSSMSSLFGRRAVVVGSGIGGLSVAGALAGCIENGGNPVHAWLSAAPQARARDAPHRNPHRPAV